MQFEIESGSALPADLRCFAGEILDVDSHEMMPAQVWNREIGAITEPLVTEWLTNGQDVTVNPNHPNCPDYPGDIAPIDGATIWRQKGSLAPGALDVSRREPVMDLMGVKRQLCFPTGVGMWGAYLVMNHDDMTMLPGITENRIEYGKQLCQAYNQWAIEANRTSSRVRFVLPVFGDTVDELMANAGALVNGGIRAVWLPSCLLPGGKSPAHYDLDPFWTLMTDNDVSVCLHVGPDQPFKSAEWGNAPVFDGFRILNEFKADPWTLSANFITAQNFLATVVVGGVFERHPALRFGVIETGGYWVGPLCDSLDLWHEHSAAFGGPKSFRLPRRPSDYIRSNVRVSCFDFEPVDKFITRYDLGDVLCFATDYPHIEGGTNPAGDWLQCLRPLGWDTVEKFFVSNGQWILPD